MKAHLVLLLAYLSLVAVVFGEGTYTMYQEALKAFPARDFMLLAETLKDYVGKTYMRHTEGQYSIALKEQGPPSVKILEPLASTMTITNNKIVLTLSRPVEFLFDYFLDFNTYLLPLTGSCRLRLKPVDTEFSLEISGQDVITPSWQTSWEVDVVSISNDIANHINITKALQHMLQKDWFTTPYTLLFDRVFKEKHTEEYRKYIFNNRTAIVVYPYLYNAGVHVNNFMSRQQLSNQSLNVYFTTTVVGSGQENQDLNKFWRKEFISYETLIQVIEKSISLTNNITLRDKDIRKNSIFRLDLLSLLRIFPDCLMDGYYANKVMVASLTGVQGNVKKEVCIATNRLTLTGMRYNISLYFERDPAPFLNATVDVNITYTPSLSVHPYNMAASYLNLIAVKGDVSLVSASARLNDGHMLFKSSSIATAAYDALSNYFMKYYNGFALGNGYPLFKDRSIDLGKSYAKVMQEGIEAILNVEGSY